MTPAIPVPAALHLLPARSAPRGPRTPDAALANVEGGSKVKMLLPIVLSDYRFDTGLTDRDFDRNALRRTR